VTLLTVRAVIAAAAAARPWATEPFAPRLRAEQGRFDPAAGPTFVLDVSQGSGQRAIGRITFVVPPGAAQGAAEGNRCGRHGSRARLDHRPSERTHDTRGRDGGRGRARKPGRRGVYAPAGREAERRTRGAAAWRRPAPPDPPHLRRRRGWTDAPGGVLAPAREPPGPQCGPTAGRASRARTLADARGTLDMARALHTGGSVARTTT
jgi:hypothetical protein